MGAGGCGWVRVGAGGCGWVRVGAGGCGWVRVGAGGCGWVRWETAEARQQGVGCGLLVVCILRVGGPKVKLCGLSL